MQDERVFDKKAALALVDNDEELLQILISSFLTENKFDKPELKKLLDDGKTDEAARYVHATKGAARQLCMEKLKTSGQALEDVLRGKVIGDISMLTERMFDDYEEAVKAVSAV